MPIFSGLKTAALRLRDGLIGEQGGLRQTDRSDLCAAFQQAVTETLAEKARRALSVSPVPLLAVAGGVAANGAIRAALERTALEAGARFLAPPLRLCTDNGAMIAWAGIERLKLGLTDGLDFAPRPRWPLDPDAPKRVFAGVKA